jgi:O-antigen/teichoic acid export membrane protein
MSGRGLAFVVTFAIPAVLARTLNPTEFGTYRLLFLIYGTLFNLAQMGMAESLYYFLPQRPERAGRWVGNAVATLVVLGAAMAVVTAAAAPTAAHWFRNPLLAEHLPKIGLFLGLMLASTSLEIVMVCRRKYRQAATTYGLSDVARAASLTIPAILAHSVDALLTGIVLFAVIRCLLAIVYLRMTFGNTLGLDRELWKEQIAYALPFTAAVTVETVQENLHQYAVALWFTPTLFAVYSIGCLQIPLVGLLATSAANVLMVSISEKTAVGPAPLRVWHETSERLSFVFFPLVVVLELTSHDFFAVLFPRYPEAAPIFMLSALAFALPAFPVDAMLRAYARTRTLMMLSLLRLAIIATLIAWFVSMWGLKGAVAVTLAGAVSAKAVGIYRVGRLLDVSVRGVLPWQRLTVVLGAALAAAVPAWFLKAHVQAPPLLMMAMTATLYAVAYLAFVSVGALVRGVPHPAAQESEAA